MKTKIKNLLLLTFPSLLITLFLLELCFRLIIPACNTPYYYYDSVDQILRFDTAKTRMGLFTVGNLAQIRVHWRVNNFGWNSNLDYAQKHDKPLVAIIGDSYIEGLQVNPENNIAAKLRDKIGKIFEVYNFGIGGAPLIQYLQMARYVKKYFNPDLLIINVIHNDFDESLGSVSIKVGMVHLNINNGQITEEITPYAPSKIRRIIRLSSLARYFYINLQSLQNLKNWFTPKKDFNANIKVKKVMDKYDDIVKAVDYTLTRFKAENLARHIVFMIDAPRRDLYHNNLGRSNVVWMNKLLKEKCAEYDFYFIDLSAPFAEDYRKHHQRFESVYDNHWNEYGHARAAEALEDELRRFGLLK